MIKSWADRLFRWYCHPDYYADIKGDLEEIYQDNLTAYPASAKWKYFMDVLLLFRPELLKPFFKNSILNTGMFQNYFKISIRNLVKHKVYTAINVIGLAIGLAAFLMINQYIRFERSYDNFFTKSASLYRLTTDQVKDGVLGTRDAMSFNPSGRALKEELPEVINYTATYKFSEVVFRHESKVRFEKNIVGADSNYFQLFDYPVLQGNPETMLDKPYSLVLSRSKAVSYFGNTDPMGKTIEVLGGFNRPFEITGIIEDIPENTHYKFDILLSLNSIREILEREAWDAYNYYTYLEIDEKADFDLINSKLPDLAKKYLDEETTLRFNLQPVTDIHLYSDFTYEPEIHGSAKAVNFLVIISIFVLVIAWVNYINLSTARSVDRAKEVGLRKVIGAKRAQLIIQFFFESLIINFLGALAAVGLAELVLPLFNGLIEKEIATHIWTQRQLLWMVLIFFVTGTFVTGLYPSLVLSGFEPLTVIKGKFKNSKSGVLLRKSLVVIQFAVSIVLIAGTLTVVKQVEFMQSRDMGFDMESVIGFVIPRVAEDEREELREELEVFLGELRDHSYVLDASSISNLPGGGSSDISSASGGIKVVGVTERADITVYIQYYDDRTIGTLGMDLKYGRNFSREIASDTFAVIVNEAFLNKLGISDHEAMISEKIQFGRNPENDKHSIVGVLKDFNRTSLKNEIEPTCIFYYPGVTNAIVKLDPSRYREGMDLVHAKWQEFFPDHPLDITFLDQRFEKLYKEDKRFGRVFGSFATLAIFVGILGLFGLSSFLASQKTKEVGVRKVLGASIGNIIGIFYKDFIVLIGLSTVIGLPMVYFVMDNWLDNYAYRISFPWYLMLTAVVVVLFSALATVGYQTYKVAAINPSKTLRYE